MESKQSTRTLKAACNDFMTHV